jgi:pyridoxal phosphate enzyme (YggS family)
MINSIAERLTAVRSSISQACLQCQRDSNEVTLIAVSKTKPNAAIAAAMQAGQTHFGENYVQEALQKIQLFADETQLTWHFIGPIQSNKTRDIAEHFHWVHSVDRSKIAQRLSQQRPSKLPPLNVLIQVNIDDEGSKSGVTPAQVAELAAEITQLPQLKLRGLMAIPRPSQEALQQAQSLAAMERLFLQLKAQYSDLDTLSMGMSDDLTVAIAHGSTMVRIGSAIFGPRDNNQPSRSSE